MDARIDPNAWGVPEEPLSQCVLRDGEKPVWNKSRQSVTSTIRYGDRLALLAVDGDWQLIQSTHDNYIGWIKAATLEPIPDHQTVRVSVRSTHIYPAPDLKTPPVRPLTLGARLCAFETDGDFTRVDEGYVFTPHIAETSNEPAYWAGELLGTPYLWGGGTSSGIDCSGLTQLCYAMQDRDIPRDTDQQENQLREVTFNERARNDLVYWPGHVGILIGRDTMIHATAYKMATITEPLTEAIARIGKPSSIRRVV